MVCFFYPVWRLRNEGRATLGYSCHRKMQLYVGNIPKSKGIVEIKEELSKVTGDT
jgi:hypothetical protein